MPPLPENGPTVETAVLDLDPKGLDDSPVPSANSREEDQNIINAILWFSCHYLYIRKILQFTYASKTYTSRATITTSADYNNPSTLLLDCAEAIKMVQSVSEEGEGRAWCSG